MRAIKIIISLALSLAILLCITACGSKVDVEESKTTEITEGPTETNMTEKNTEPGILDGKRIVFIGDSFVYYGNVVLEKSTSVLTQEKRQNDEGYFYQLCKANGADVSVTNWTFGGHGLGSFGPAGCNTSHSCAGVDHMSYLTDRNYDYVVISGGRSNNSAATFLEDMEYLMGIFKAANPDVKFLYLVSSGAHNVSVKETFPTNILNNLKTIDGWGVTVVDWGKLVKNIIEGKVTVEGGSATYNKNSFIIEKSSSDGYHPNQLTGYITALMTYCAITGESAVGQPYSFCGDTSLSTDDSYLSFSSFIARYYLSTGAGTNYDEIFSSKADMEGLQQLIDQHLAEKAYLDYNY